MSRLHELVVDLGIEVDKFSNRIEEEKRKINETKARFDRQLKQRLQKEEESSALEAELERLQKRCFVAATNAASATCRPYLMKALGEVRAAAQRMRDERMEILSEYKAKLDHCEVLCRRNTMLEAFIDSWRKSLAEGKNISELPELIKNVSAEVAHFYTTPVHQLLEAAIKEAGKEEETLHENGDSPMEISTASVPAPKTTFPPAGQSVSTKPPVSDGFPIRLEPMSETICNSTTTEASICHIRGGPEPSIILGHDSPHEFSRLDCLDTTLTDRQGIYSEEALRDLMQTGSDTTLNQE